MPFTKETIEQTRETYNKYMNCRSVSTLTNDLVNFIKKYFELEQNKNSKAIIGISTGKDSTCLLGLLTKAIGPERVICVSMPLYSLNKDDKTDILKLKDETINIIDYFKIPRENRIESPILESDLGLIREMPLTLAGAGMVSLESAGTTWDMQKPEIRNLAARIRMVKLYYLAQKYNARVMNTSNLSESVVGWFTKWGDCCGDLFPFIELTASEVVLVGLELGIPEHAMFKVPDDGLIGTSDEEALGFTYNQLDEEIMKIRAMENEVFSIALEQYLPKDMRDRYISGFHKHFSMYISHGENGYTPVFYNTPLIEVGKQKILINNLN